MSKSPDVIFSEGCSIDESLFQSPTSRCDFEIEYSMPSSLSNVYNLKLRKPIPVTIRLENGYFFVSNTELEITEGGSSLEQALGEFTDFFLDDYLNWRNIKDSEITAKAARIKQAYLEFVEETPF
jgi:hypothetical protein